MKTNEENAKANYKQYEANAEISAKNIQEVNDALKDKPAIHFKTASEFKKALQEAL